MEWTVRWYVHMAEKWQSRRNAEATMGLVSHSHRAYAKKQMVMWNELGRVSDSLFSDNSSHITVWKLVI